MTKPFKVLVTGAFGFTGRYVVAALRAAGYDPVPLRTNLTDKKALTNEVLSVNPSHVVHLAGVSYVASDDVNSIYNVNVVGSVNLLEALSALNSDTLKVILASSATVYGDVKVRSVSEKYVPRPVNHYGCSKLAMEHMAQNYRDKFDIIIARPFNYTGVGQNERFLIPKIIAAYANGNTSLELGNINVSREFNDVRDVSEMYVGLLQSRIPPVAVNLCSGNSISLLNIIEVMNSISNINMKINVNPQFVRVNEIKDLSGNPSLLLSSIYYKPKFSIDETVRWMYESNTIG
jgi:nucleoside-diphosphate-sugar epimerase